MINKAKELVDKFTRAEYKVKKMRYDESFSDEDCTKAFRSIKKLLHPIMEEPSPSIGRIANELENPLMKKCRKQNYDNVKKRDLFLIREYKNFTLSEGNVIKEIIRSDSIYACITSSSNKYGDDETKEYAQMYIAAETNKGLKFIYLFHYRDEGWFGQHAFEPTFIIAFGDLKSHQNFMAPEEEICLKDYNMEEFIL